MTAATSRLTSNPGLAELMQAYGAGDDAAFRDLYLRLAHRLHGYVRALGLPRDGAEDVVQRTFLNAHRFRGQYRPGASTGAPDDAVVNWFFTIARNDANNMRRQHARHRRRVRRWRAHRALAEAAAERADPQQRIMDAETRARSLVDLRRAVARLPSGQRIVLELHALRGLPMAEVSERLGVRCTTLRVRIHRAQRTLAKRLAYSQRERAA